MEIERPNQRALTPEEQKELDHLRTVIEQAIADGVISRSERDRIASVMRTDGKVTFEELTLVRTLIHEKAARGELVLDYSER